MFRARNFLLQKRFISNSLALHDNYRQRLVILGSGWGGFKLLQSIDKTKLDVTMISPRNHFIFTPLLASSSVGTLEFRCIMEPIRTHSPDEFYLASCERIDWGSKTLFCRSNLPPKTCFTVDYDKLVIAVGAFSNTFNIPGVKEYGLFLKDAGNARKIRGRIIEYFEKAGQPNMNEQDQRDLLHFAIVGAGPTGVEFSAELYDFIVEDCRKLYPDLVSKVKISVYDVADKILSTFDERLRAEATRRFQRNGIEIRTHTFIKELKENTMVLREGEEIKFGMLVWATGLAPNPLVNALSGIRKDERSGRIHTNGYLQVLDGNGEAMEDVYAIGDCAAIEKLHPALPCTAQVASQKAKYLAKALNKEEGKENEEFTYKHLGSMAYIGGWTGIVDFHDIQSKNERSPILKGHLAWLFWRSAYFTMTVSWRNKLLIPMFWFLTWAFGRDVTSFRNAPQNHSRYFMYTPSLTMGTEIHVLLDSLSHQDSPTNVEEIFTSISAFLTSPLSTEIIEDLGWKIVVKLIACRPFENAKLSDKRKELMMLVADKISAKEILMFGAEELNKVLDKIESDEVEDEKEMEELVGKGLAIGELLHSALNRVQTQKHSKFWRSVFPFLARLSTIQSVTTKQEQSVKFSELFQSILESCRDKLPIGEETSYSLCEDNEDGETSENAQRYRLILDLASNVAMNIMSSLDKEVDEEKGIIEKFVAIIHGIGIDFADIAKYFTEKRVEELADNYALSEDEELEVNLLEPVPVATILYLYLVVHPNANLMATGKQLLASGILMLIRHFLQSIERLRVPTNMLITFMKAVISSIPPSYFKSTDLFPQSTSESLELLQFYESYLLLLTSTLRDDLRMALLQLLPDLVSKVDEEGQMQFCYHILHVESHDTITKIIGIGLLKKLVEAAFRKQVAPPQNSPPSLFASTAVSKLLIPKLRDLIPTSTLSKSNFFEYHAIMMHKFNFWIFLLMSDRPDKNVTGVWNMYDLDNFLKGTLYPVKRVLDELVKELAQEFQKMNSHSENNHAHGSGCGCCGVKKEDLEVDMEIPLQQKLMEASLLDHTLDRVIGLISDGRVLLENS